MATLVVDLWRDALPSHEIFCKLQESRHLEPQGTSRRIVKNLTFCLNGDLFVWDNLESVFYTTNLRQLNNELVSHTDKHQVRFVYYTDKVLIYHSTAKGSYLHNVIRLVNGKQN